MLTREPHSFLVLPFLPLHGALAAWPRRIDSGGMTQTTATHTILMTGAGSGIGRHAALRLLDAAPDAHLVVLHRGGRDLAGELAAASGHPHVSEVRADLASISETRAAAAEVAARLSTGQLPLLAAYVGNAGVQVTSGNRASVDGLELTFAVNVVANHVVLHQLGEQLLAPARVVITTSDTHFGDFRHNMGMVPAPVWRDPEKLMRPGVDASTDTLPAGRTAYSTSKLAVLHHVHALARQLALGVDAYAWNPGFVPATGLARDASRLQQFAMRRIMPLLTLTPLSVNATTAGSALADLVTGKISGPSGSYVDLDHVADSSPESYDSTRENLLWESLEQLVASV